MHNIGPTQYVCYVIITSQQARYAKSHDCLLCNLA